MIKPTRQAALLAGVLILGLLARLPGLLSIPLFFDESVYLARALAFPHELTRTLADGKLIQELLLALLVLLPGDPLVWGRLLSLACGVGMMLVLAYAGTMIGHPHAGLIAALLWAIAPVAILHDALAIPDSMLTLAGCGLLLLSLRFATHANPTRRDAALLGGMLACAALVKLPGLFLFCVPVLAVVCFRPTWPERWKRLALLRMTLIVALVVLAALAPLHYGGAEQAKLGGNWLVARWENLSRAVAWLAAYLPLPVAIPALVVVALPLNRTRPDRLFGWLVASGISFILIFVVVGGQIASRYLLPAWPSLLLAAALAIETLWQSAGWRRWLGLAATSIAIAWGSFFAVMLGIDPMRAPLVTLDRWQYFQSWTAGYRGHELLDVLEQAIASGGTITIVNHDQPRLVHNLPLIYLHNRQQATIVTIDLTTDAAPAEVLALAQQGPTFVLLDEQERSAFDFERRFPQAQQQAVFPNPYSDMRMYVFRVQS